MSSTDYSREKVQTIQKLKKELLSSKIIGLVKINNIGARVVQQMRKDLRKESTRILMAKNSLMKIAIDEVNDEIQGIEQMSEYISGPCAFLLTDTNPFKLANYMASNKVPAPAKAGQLAPNDVEIPSMNTGIPPGPVISELQSIGLKTRIEGGQIKIAEKAVVTKEGEKVSGTVASLLRRLEIDPFEAGLDIVVALDGGSIIMGKELLIDYEQYRQTLEWAIASSMNLAVNAGIFTKRSIPLIIANARRNSLNLAVNGNIINSISLPIILSKIIGGAQTIAKEVSSINPEALSSETIDRLNKITVENTKTSENPPKTTVQEPESEKEEEEEDLGLGALFG